MKCRSILTEPFFDQTFKRSLFIFSIMLDYLNELNLIASGELEKVPTGYLLRGKTRYWFLEPANLVRVEEVYKLPSLVGDHTTPQGRYQSVINRVLQNTDGNSSFDSGIIRLANPHNNVNSIFLAEETYRMFENPRLVKVDISDYVTVEGELKPGFIWDPDFQKLWGSLNSGNVYLVAGLEKLNEMTLEKLFKCPDFESGFEGYQEMNRRWDEIGHNHGVIILASASADVAFDRESRSSGFGSTSGGIQNYLERVSNKAYLFCVDFQPEVTNVKSH